MQPEVGVALQPIIGLALQLKVIAFQQEVLASQCEVNDVRIRKVWQNARQAKCRAKKKEEKLHV